MSTTPQPTDELFSRIAGRLQALSDPTRLKILHALENRERCVSDLLVEVGGSQANLSKHLARMRLAGIVASRREGTNVFYRVADPTAFVICRTVCDSLERQVEHEQRTLRAAIEAGRQGAR